MPDPRNDEQRRWLEHEYARRTDAELKNLADAGSSLTDVAREVLRAEIIRRGLGVAVADEVSVPAASSAPVLLLPIVRVYRDLPDALIARSILDSAGIECSLFDENIVRLNWLWSYAVHSIKLRVTDEDAADAAQLLDQPRLESFDVEGVGTYIEPRCPNCQSLDVSFRPLIKLVAYGLLFFGLALPAKRPAWRCASCRHEWRTGEPGEHLPLNWNLIRLLWIVGLALDFTSQIDRFGSLSGWFWLAYVTISVVLLARYAVDRVFTHAFLVGLVADTGRFLVWGLSYARFIDSNVDVFTILIICYNAAIAGALGGISLIVTTWLAMFVVPARKPRDHSHSDSGA
jgi:hypothetical protein